MTDELTGLENELLAKDRRIADLEAALTVEESYWDTRLELARTATERIMAEYHLLVICAALAEDV